MSTTFSVPAGKTTEGYMGGGGWVGGNYEKVSGGNFVGLTGINKMIRADIKDAVKAGFMPGKINGSKLKFRVTKSGGAVNVDIVVEGATYFDILCYKNSIAPYDNDDMEDDVVSKMYQIVDSYRYDESNSMVDYFSTNFYRSIKITGSMTEEEARRAIVGAMRRAKKELRGSAKNREELMDMVARKLEQDSKFMEKYNNYVLATILENVEVDYWTEHRESGYYFTDRIDVDMVKRYKKECETIIKNFKPSAKIDDMKKFEGAFYFA